VRVSDDAEMLDQGRQPGDTKSRVFHTSFVCTREERKDTSGAELLFMCLRGPLQETLAAVTAPDRATTFSDRERRVGSAHLLNRKLRTLPCLEACEAGGG
jgi:hypothetical protein